MNGCCFGLLLCNQKRPASIVCWWVHLLHISPPSNLRTWLSLVESEAFQQMLKMTLGPMANELVNGRALHGLATRVAPAVMRLLREHQAT